MNPGMESHNQLEKQSSPEKSGSSSSVSKKVAEMWERMNEGVPKKRVNFNSMSSAATALPAKNSANSNWKKKKKKKKSDLIVVQKKEDSVSDNSCSEEEAKSIAAAALAAVRNATATAAAASSRGKIEITEVKDFAGQEIQVKRLVEAGSKASSSSSSSSSAAAATPSAVDAVLEQIKKKQKLSVLDKTKKDWGEYKEENKGVEDELDKYKKSSDQYLDKVSFLERADYRQFEKERDARLALQSKRRHDDA